MVRNPRSVLSEVSAVDDLEKQERGMETKLNKEAGDLASQVAGSARGQRSRLQLPIS